MLPNRRCCLRLKERHDDRCPLFLSCSQGTRFDYVHGLLSERHHLYSNSDLLPLDSNYVWRFEEDNFVHGWCIEETSEFLRISNRLGDSRTIAMTNRPPQPGE